MSTLGTISGDLPDVALRFLTFLQHRCQGKPNASFISKEVPQLYLREFAAADLRASRLSCFSVTAHLKKMKYIFFKGNIMFLKMVRQTADKFVFTVAPSAAHSDTYLVCLICSRGFGSRQGLDTHRKSDSHQLNALKYMEEANDCEMEGGVFVCPVCQQKFKALHPLKQHLKDAPHERVVECVASVADERDGNRSNGPSYPCLLCGISCTSQSNLDDHFRGKVHKLKELRNGYRTNRNQLLRDKGGVTVVPILAFGDCKYDTRGLVHVTSDQKCGSITFRVENSSASSKKLTSCSSIDSANAVSFAPAKEPLPTPKAPVTVKPGGSYELRVTLTVNHYGCSRIPLTFTFQGEQRLDIVREVIFNCTLDHELHEMLQPKSAYVRPPPRIPSPPPAEIVDGVRPNMERDDRLKFTAVLDEYPLPAFMAAVAGNRKVDDIKLQLCLDKLDFANYSNHFNNLLHLEEVQMKTDILAYRMTDAPMRLDKRFKLLVLDVPGLAENRPSVLRGDRIMVSRSGSGDKRRYVGYVHVVEQTSIKLGFNKSLCDSFVDGMKFNVEFTVNRLPVKLEHRACTWAALPVHDLESVLFPWKNHFLGPMATISGLRFFNELVGQNPQQRLAVERIVSGSSRPAPYLIYGPPGTGKTVTLVEAVKQVKAVFKASKILACAPQNNAADLLAERLLKHVDKHEILRLNASTRSINNIYSDTVKEISNYNRGTKINPLRAESGSEVYFPAKEELMKYQIIVCTLVTAGRLVSAELKDHFTHLFIDESGHATEPETIIALAGLFDVNKKLGGQLVLAGDPKQLGPIIRSHYAQKYGLGVSLLERLMLKEEPYQRQPLSGQYDERVVTKLIRSFRSHPHILEVPNRCFYDYELEVCADKMEREKFCMWECLPKRGFPIIFHGLDGEEKQDKSSPSWFNPHEVLMVVEYCRKLFSTKNPEVKAEHIGIITPYHQQVMKIKQALAIEDTKAGRDRRFRDIKVGSVEVFQGEERPVIIISTVRCCDKYLEQDVKFNLGFLRNAKRFNVAVTRAKSLLIIIGCPRVLKADTYWDELITYCCENGGYTGCPLPEEEDGIDMEEITAKLDALNLGGSIGLDVSEVQLQIAPEWVRRD